MKGRLDEDVIRCENGCGPLGHRCDQFVETCQSDGRGGGSPYRHPLRAGQADRPRLGSCPELAVEVRR
jgi:hypothetical protein